MSSSFRFWSAWLVAVAAAAVVFGAVMVLQPSLTQRFFDSLLLPPSGGSADFAPLASSYVRFVTAILGAVMAGLGASMLLALLGPFRRRQPDGWRMIAVPVAVWFVLDTGYSLWSGYWRNAVLNTVALVLFALPLAMTFRAFHPGSDDPREKNDGS